LITEDHHTRTLDDLFGVRLLVVIREKSHSTFLPFDSRNQDSRLYTSCTIPDFLSLLPSTLYPVLLSEHKPMPNTKSTDATGHEVRLTAVP
jgi:hypothetical protein